MRTLAIDIETYSSVDLIACGVYAYTESPDFTVLLFGYAIDDAEKPGVFDLTKPGARLPDWVIDALTDPDWKKTAYNANFERTCLARYLKMPMPPEQWSCTAVMAAELGLPRSLAQVGAAIGLPEDKQKLKTGKELIRYFSIPCKPTKANGQRTRNYPEHDPEKWKQYIEYNRQDVVTEREIRRRLEKFGENKSEHALWVYDQNINDRGVLCDLELAGNAVEFDEHIKDQLFIEAQELTGLENPKSTAQVKAWIENEAGIEVESLNKKAIGAVRTAADSENVDKLLNIRAQLSKTSTSKYEAMVRCACADGRIRGLTQFYGANRTGRWAGRQVQMQNLPQNKLPEEELNFARELVKAGDLKTFEMMFDDTAGTLSQLIRTAFIPKPGHIFIVSDFSAIEARVLAWLAQEKWRLENFKNGGDIYCASASQMFHVPVEKHGVNGHLRQKGKIAELALGYGGSVGAMKAMGALEMGIPEEELKPIVDSWRAANKAVTKFWWDVDAAARKTITTQAPASLKWGIKFYKQGPLMKLTLPCGRDLAYVKPAIVDDSITYEGTIQASGGWGRIESYGPKLVENIVQATARDCLAEAIKRLELLGFPVVFHVHDEVILEVKRGETTPEEIAEIMGQPIDWAPGLLLSADAYACEYYRKD